MSFFTTVATSNSDQLVRSLLETSSEDEEEKKRHGSLPGRAPNLERHSAELGAILYKQYFADNPTYDDAAFRRRFRVSREIFVRVFDAVVNYDPYFTQKRDCTDFLDDKIGIGESTTLESLDHFCDAVKELFGKEYLRSPTNEDIKRILVQSKRRGFPGMLGSIDCSNWRWKNRPTAWQGEFRGKEKASAVTLEAIADQSLWVWHAFLGMPGCMNEINVVEASPLLDKIANGEYPPPCEYRINGVRRNKPYCLTDLIYPAWPVFIDTMMNPSTRKHKLFVTMQEAARKDIERAFGVLRIMWHIITIPSRFESIPSMQKVMTCVVILYDMVVKKWEFAVPMEGEMAAEDVLVRSGVSPMWEGMVKVSYSMEDPVTPGSLTARCKVQQFTTRTMKKNLTKRLLIDHQWEHHGDM